jgi:hypothetical protein
MGENYTRKTHFFQNFPDFFVEKKVKICFQEKTLIPT